MTFDTSTQTHLCDGNDVQYFPVLRIKSHSGWLRCLVRVHHNVLLIVSQSSVVYDRLTQLFTTVSFDPVIHDSIV